MFLLFFSFILIVGILLPLVCFEAFEAVRKVTLVHLKLRILTFSEKVGGFANQLFGITFEYPSPSTSSLRSSVTEYDFSDG